jgi:hypothetical protein
MDFSDAIKLNKPKISEGSLKTYNSLLRSVYSNLFLDETKGYQLNPSPSIFSTEYKKVLNFLSKKTYSSRKTYLAALYAIAPDIEEYKRILKPAGCIALTGTLKFGVKLIQQAEDLYKYDWIWEKSRPSNFLMRLKQPLKYYETISMFYNNNFYN